MKIRNPFNKKTLFDVFEINENAPDKYEQLYCKIATCDDRFYAKIVPLKIISQDKYVEDRLMDTVPSITSQFIEMYHADKNSFRSNFYFNNFKACMEKLGVGSVCIEDWANIATIAFADHIKNKYKDKIGTYSVAASFIGYIDLSDQKGYAEVYDDLYTIKKKYKSEMKNTVRDSDYYKNMENNSKPGDMRIARNFFDNEMNLIEEKRNENLEIEK